MGLIFRDEFDTFSTSRWQKAVMPAMGRSAIKTENVDALNGNLRLKVPANTLEGGRILSKQRYSHGEYLCRMKACPQPSSLTAFYLYSPPDLDYEIDLEYYDNTLDFVVWANGQRQDFGRVSNFDGHSDYHDYRIVYSQTHAAFYVDEELAYYSNIGVPLKSMPLQTMLWFPDWLPGTIPTQDEYALFDYIEVRDVF